MVEQFKRTCSYCGKPIVMKKQPIGGWKAYENDKEGITHHNCRQPYYKEPVSKDTRDKSMAPKQPTPHGRKERVLQDIAREKWEEENKELQEQAWLKAKKQDTKSEQQILITEISKQTHLLNAILEVLTKKDDEEND